MFGKRKDGIKIKKLSPMFILIPYIMKERHDAQNLYLISARCEPFDNLISQNKKVGIRINYMHIIIALVVRLYALKPHLNRFVINGRYYKRKNISVSIAVKKTLKDYGDETTIKLKFKGTEDVYQVKKIVDESIKENCNPNTQNKADKIASLITSVPNIFIKYTIVFIKWLDKHGMLMTKIIDSSPFHTSCFLTNLKSINMDFIYHHLYDFGTTGMFISMGKEKYEPVLGENNILEAGKVMNLGIVIDERICDGLYYANSLKLLKKMMKDPSILEKNLNNIVEDID